jgi:ubiquinone/menaquinone biosynthesis C-methylase UbiE
LQITESGDEKEMTMTELETVQQFWDEYICGDVFTPLTDRYSGDYLAEVRANRYKYEYHLLPFLAEVSKAGPRVLEIGCSMGMDTAELAAMGCQMTGVDLSPKSIEVAQNHFAMRGLSADLRVGNAEALEFPDATFDAVYSFGVLHHTPHIEQALDEVYRVLKPNGKIFLMLYNRHSLNNLVHVVLRLPYESPRNWKTDAPITKTFSRGEVSKLVDKFQNHKIEMRYLFGAGWRPVSDYVPVGVNDALGRVMGWHWMIQAQKAS